MTAVPDRLTTALADRYTIERELGAGGMATVYLAQDLKHGRKVALKVLRPELAAVLGAERFVQEIRTTAALQHPHILPLFDSGEADGFLYYVMPFIEGETLREKLNRETQISIEESVRITVEVADALQYAHEQGVIHRDIKPENILLHAGRPIVADFGIALAVSAAAGGRMTETGMSLGTPHYMSPEQATADKDISNRSDIYALGSVLYEMLTGDPPHTASSAQAIIMKIIAEDPEPVTTRRRSVPPNVAAAVGKSLEKLPADRFDTAKAFAEALTNPSFTSATVASPGPAVLPSYRPAVLIAGLAAIVVLAALAAWGWLRSAPELPTTREWISLSLVRPGGMLDQSWPVNVAITRDGSAIVFADSSSSGPWQLLLKEQESDAAVPIPGTLGGMNPFLSPDGQWIGFATERGLYRIPRNGGAPTKLSDSTASLAAGVFASGVWLDDGTIVFAGKDNQHLLQIDADGGAERVVLRGSDWPPQGIVRLAGLPRGRGVLMTSCGASPCSRSVLWMLDLARDTLIPLVADVSSGWYLPTGHVLYGRSDGTLFAQRLDLDAGRLTGAAIPVMSGLVTTAGLPALGVSPSGTALYALRTVPGSGGFASSRLVWVDRDGTTGTLDSALSLPGSEQAQLGVSLAPDGSRLAFVQNTDEGPQIFVKRMPDGPVTRVTFGGWSARPTWSPDGRELVFIRFRSDVPSVAARQRADGSDTATIAAEETRPIAEALLSPDGKWLVYRTNDRASGAGDILARRLSDDTGTVALIATPAEELAPAISPDGRWLAYTSNEGGETEVFVRPWPDVNRAKWQVSHEGGTAPQWSPDSRELFYRSSRQELMAVQLDGSPTFNVRQTRTLFSVASYQVESAHATYAVERNGTRFIFGRQDSELEPNASRLILVRHWFSELRPLLEGR